jgi:PhzF family phenazine biosynthesis protein
MPRRFRQVDVFTVEPYLGNPVAVVLDADGLTTEEMQRFTRWTNLSEATFVLSPSKPAADYRVRIFTSAAATASRSGFASELPFAGHPTLGTCHAWLEASGVPKQADVVLQECRAGLVRVRRTEGALAFAAPPLIRSGPVEESVVEHIASALRIRRDEIIDAAWVDNGPGWVAVLLPSAPHVLSVKPSFVDLDLGVVGLYPEGSATALEVRAFFPKDGTTAEDPVTGEPKRVGGAVVTRDRPGDGPVRCEPRDGAQSRRPCSRLARRRRDDLDRRRHRHVRERRSQAIAPIAPAHRNTSILMTNDFCFNEAGLPGAFKLLAGYFRNPPSTRADIYGAASTTTSNSALRPGGSTLLHRHRELHPCS